MKENAERMVNKKRETITGIFFVRHGQSINNVRNVENGEPENDPGLSVLGKKQVKQLAVRLKKEGISEIYSSHMPRCIQTSSIIAKALNKKVVLNKKFREPLQGKIEGLTQQQVEKKFPKLASMLYSGDTTNLILGESFKHVQARVWKEVELLAKTHEGKKILIVTHQAVVKTTVCKLFGGLKYFNKFKLSNASVTLFHKQGKNYKLAYLNDISHLR